MNRFAKIQNSLTFFLLIVLAVFLPLSAWAVSYFGNSNISLIRDFLIGLIFLLAFFNIKRTPAIVIPVIILVVYAAVSFFWKEASVLQWLKGYRFLFGPIFLFLSLSLLYFKDSQKKALIKLVIAMGVFVILLSALEFLGVKLPLTSKWSGALALDQTHFIGGVDAIRLKSILAGPNALGLYLLVLFSYCLAFIKKSWIKFPLLFLIVVASVLTFSRSTWAGLIVFALAYSFILLKTKIGVLKTTMLLGIISLAILFLGLNLYQNESYEKVITHDDSNTRRIEQYERIWQSRYEIGLLGRGTGTAGPSSQVRLDQGENHWTENIYLDIFEELGLIGLVLYLAVIISMLIFSWKRIDRSFGLASFLSLFSFSIAGLFINYYTGQVGIFLVWLALGLSFSERKNNG